MQETVKVKIPNNATIFFIIIFFKFKRKARKDFFDYYAFLSSQRRKLSEEIQKIHITFFFQAFSRFQASTQILTPYHSQPGLNGALFVERSGTKKREWKTDKAALKTFIINLSLFFFL
ncbi:hypothetical protein EAG08_00500 [Chryseobacterium sp. 3008163]|nr:hypothetical protein EAG08_00500 [Chryseobacterium sp. 3008163]